jgi:hypothetical protein
LGSLAILFEYLDPGFISLQVGRTVLRLPHQMDQRFEHLIQTDDPVRHAGAAQLMAQTFEHLLLPVQRQTIGIFGGDQVGQQGRGGDAFAQRVCRASRGYDLLVAVLLEHRFFLPVFQHFELGGDIVQLFLHLGEEGFDGPGLLFITQQQLDALTQQVIEKPR